MDSGSSKPRLEDSDDHVVAKPIVFPGAAGITSQQVDGLIEKYGCKVSLRPIRKSRLTKDMTGKEWELTMHGDPIQIKECRSAALKIIEENGSDGAATTTEEREALLASQREAKQKRKQTREQEHVQRQAEEHQQKLLRRRDLWESSQREQWDQWQMSQRAHWENSERAQREQGALQGRWMQGHTEGWLDCNKWWEAEVEKRKSEDCSRWWREELQRQQEANAELERKLAQAQPPSLPLSTPPPRITPPWDSWEDEPAITGNCSEGYQTAAQHGSSSAASSSNPGVEACNLPQFLPSPVKVEMPDEDLSLRFYQQVCGSASKTSSPVAVKLENLPADVPTPPKGATLCSHNVPPAPLVPPLPWRLNRIVAEPKVPTLTRNEIRPDPKAAPQLPEEKAAPLRRLRKVASEESVAGQSPPPQCPRLGGPPVKGSPRSAMPWGEWMDI